MTISSSNRIAEMGGGRRPQALRTVRALALTVVAAAAIPACFAATAGAFVAVNGKVAFASTRDGNAEIYVMNADSTGQTNLTHSSATDNRPVWSPDSTKIAFVSTRDGNQEIYVMDADGSNVKNVTNNAASDSDPTWSPDGSKIAFASDRIGIYEIYVIGADGSNPTNVTNNAALDSRPTWSPSGAQIAFVRNTPNLEVFVMNADGSGQTNLTNHADPDNNPRWSPDGSKIAYERRVGGVDYEIFVMNANGSGQTDLSNNGAIDGDPTWSPDGSKIAFDSNRGGNTDIWIMDPSGGAQANLSASAGDDFHPSWQLAPPTCANVSQSIPFGTPTQVALGCSDPGGNPLTYQALSNPASGSLGSMGPAGNVTYTPSADFTGSDSFTYRATNGNSTSMPAGASLSVGADTTPPTSRTKTRSCAKNNRKSRGVKRRACRLRGTATDPTPGSGIARVEVNVLRKMSTRGRCITLRKNGRSKRTKCKKARRNWIRAKLKGTNPAAWSLNAQMPRGRYQVRTRAIDKAANVQTKPTKRTVAVG